MGLNKMDIHSTANEYKRIIKQKEAEIAAIEAKYATILQPYHKDLALTTFLNGSSTVFFEGWETEKKHNFLASLIKHKVNYHIEQRGGGYETYEVVIIDW